MEVLLALIVSLVVVGFVILAALALIAALVSVVSAAWHAFKGPDVQVIEDNRSDYERQLDQYNERMERQREAYQRMLEDARRTGGGR